jgi:hypothetical protein
LSVTPVGSAPVSENDDAGNPLVVTVNDPAAPIVNAALVALVIAGASFTSKVKFCVALGFTPFCAVRVRE